MNALKTLAIASLLSACAADEAAPVDPGMDLPEGHPLVVGHPPVEAPRPASCADILGAQPGATDGEYMLYVGADAQKPWMAYCADMASAPKEYLPLVAVLGDHNFSQYTAGGASPGSNVRTSYVRLRIDPATLAVDIGDERFATSTGSLTHSFSEPVSSMPFGVAMACGNDAGLANIDLRGTEFAIASTFAAVGTGGGGTTTMDPTQQAADLTGSGFCGWNAPANAPFNPFNEAHGWVLQLAYKS